jgi:hypothetical protein
MATKDYYRQPKKSSNVSIVWKEMVAAFPLVGMWTVWKIGNKKKVKLEMDPYRESRRIIATLILSYDPFTKMAFTPSRTQNLNPPK